MVEASAQYGIQVSRMGLHIISDVKRKPRKTRQSSGAAQVPSGWAKSAYHGWENASRTKVYSYCAGLIETVDTNVGCDLCILKVFYSYFVQGPAISI